MTAIRSNPLPDSAPRRPVPPLEAGDHLTRAEFERRYDATPNLKKAELLEGVVYMPPPVSDQHHGSPHFSLVGWLSLYQFATPGIRGGDNSSLRLNLDNDPQPDAYLAVQPEYGGRVQVSKDGGYIEGAPELVAEVASSSVSYDLHVKKNVYRRSGVQKYIVWRVFDRAIDWFELKQGDYVPLSPDANGVLKSHVFPGLWLDAAALIRGDMRTVSHVQNEGLASAEHASFLATLEGSRKDGR